METKKSKKANLEKFRVIFFQTGLAISLLFAITLLSWSFKVEKPLPPPDDDIVWIDVELDPNILEPTQKKPDAPKPPEPPKQTPEILTVVDNFTEAMDEKLIEEPENKVITMKKPDEKLTGEPEPPSIFAQRMPSYKNCSTLTEEKDRIACTEKKLIEELGNKLSSKNVNRISGIIYVEFVVNKKGQVSHVKLLRGIDPYLDNEVIKAVQSLEDFVPADNSGRPADIIYRWPVSFKVK